MVTLVVLGPTSNNKVTFNPSLGLGSIIYHVSDDLHFSTILIWMLAFLATLVVLEPLQF